MPDMLLGVLGAGTMGSGIALTGLLAGLRVVLVEVSPQIREQASAYIQQHLQRKGLEQRAAMLTLSPAARALSGCQVVIEAIPEDLPLKQATFAELDRLCSPPAVLATNTSTLTVTAIASAAASRFRVAGMHFFNPAPVMPLVEVARGAETSDQAIQTLVELAHKLGKTPVVTGDTPGFIVNRVARPFYGEALRLLGEGTAGHQQIDLLARLGAGFPLGPFELMDLIGIDVNLAAAQAMFAASYAEPRFRPHRIQEQMVQRGALGRKAGRGFYQYEDGARVRDDPELPSQQPGGGFVLLSEGHWAPGLSQRLAQHGYSLSETGGEPPLVGIVAAGRGEGGLAIARRYDRGLAAEVPLLCQMANLTWSAVAERVDRWERLVGFDGLFFAEGQAVSLVAGPQTAEAIREKVDAWVRGLGKLPIWLEETPGLVLPRLVCCLANEAAFALQDGVADAAGIDTAMQLGLNHPRGPLAWAASLGYRRVVAVLDHLWDEYHEERYRVAPLLRRWARQNVSEGGKSL
ncbi:MAG TPA: 3-hydroxyacyl-CoA dehydrogenase NAD-binding domain-containing protein [Anaerolineales bacterium]